jgi:uncharacterized phage infection (PIP) family protein YhgE
MLLLQFAPGQYICQPINLEESLHMKNVTLVKVATLAAAMLLPACTDMKPYDQKISDLQSKVSTLESQVAAAKSAADAANSAASSAAQAASGAQNAANQAMSAAQASQTCCNDTNEKIERMFRRSISK